MPLNTRHFDGYSMGPNLNSPFQPAEHIPGLNVGGWFDAGDCTQAAYSDRNRPVCIILYIGIPPPVEEPGVLVQNGVEMSDMATETFTSLNGRTVYDNGVVRIWECPDCKWWRRWEDARCSVCGSLRDGDAAQPVCREAVGEAAG
ncbi:MAG TPA: hypothetical protein VLY04_16900 [Bryobacteraceae bacterium]|nr:hypothetical protein [Bryobacteraceae bacterium]